MPNKKGSRIAASQARAKAAARKRTRASAPDLTGATKPVPVPETPEEEAELEDAALLNERAATHPVRTPAAAPSQYRRAATRRERQTLAVISSGSLKWELSLITAVTAACGVALAVLKLTEVVGR